MKAKITREQETRGNRSIDENSIRNYKFTGPLESLWTLSILREQTTRQFLDFINLIISNNGKQVKRMDFNIRSVDMTNL